jgi:hypothetical protein
MYAWSAISAEGDFMPDRRSPMSTPDRGSSKLFSIKTNDHEALAQAIGLARDTYEVKWWWWFGQPVIDRLELGVEVTRPQLGATVAKFMDQNGQNLRVTSEVFPYGIINPGYLLKLNVQQHPGH